MSAADALKQVKDGDRIVVGHACGEPPTLVEALVARAPELKGVEIVHMVAMGPAKYAQPGMEGSFRHNSLFVGASTRKAISEGRALHTPCFFSEIPRLFSWRILPVDVTLMQVTPPDAEGFCSLGVSVDYTLASSRSDRVTIAQMNKFMPRTLGAKIHLDEIDCIVEKDEPLIELKPPVIGDLEKAIGENVARLIEDGSTLQMGIGAIPDAVLLFLKGKKDLGIHTEMFSDGVVALAEAGVVTNKKKTINTGKFVATFLMGTRKLYDFVDGNPDVVMHPVDYTNDPNHHRPAREDGLHQRGPAGGLHGPGQRRDDRTQPVQRRRRPGRFRPRGKPLQGGEIHHRSSLHGGQRQDIADYRRTRCGLGRDHLAQRRALHRHRVRRGRFEGQEHPRAREVPHRDCPPRFPGDAHGPGERAGAAGIKTLLYHLPLLLAVVRVRLTFTTALSLVPQEPCVGSSGVHPREDPTVLPDTRPPEKPCP